jgi:cell division protein FtsN
MKASDVMPIIQLIIMAIAVAVLLYWIGKYAMNIYKKKNRKHVTPRMVIPADLRPEGFVTVPATQEYTYDAPSKLSAASKYDKKYNDEQLRADLIDGYAGDGSAKSQSGFSSNSKHSDYEDHLTQSLPGDVIKNHETFLSERKSYMPTSSISTLQAEPEFAVGSYYGMGRRSGATISNDNTTSFSQLGTWDSDRANSAWDFDYGTS